MTGYPAITDCAVTAAAMRAAAAIIEESGLPGLSVTCSSREIAVQVSAEAGTAAERAAQVGQLAGIAGTHAYRDDSTAGAWSSVRASGQARGIPVTIYTPLHVRTGGPAGDSPLAAGPGGQVVPVPGGKLPRGHRWVTDLDDAPGAQQEAV
ncbi:MAG TPA: hypothetical protein VMK84_09480 [Streptosporangiaceae bacterium]|nr:hypothetical protein [Streptosporangiaceae bacterium]